MDQRRNLTHTSVHYKEDIIFEGLEIVFDLLFLMIEISKFVADCIELVKMRSQLYGLNFAVKLDGL